LIVNFIEVQAQVSSSSSKRNAGKRLESTSWVGLELVI